MTPQGATAGRTRLSAFDALIRGLANLRANWELALVLWFQAVAVTVLTVVGFVPPLMLFDLDGLDAGLESLGNWDQAAAVMESLMGIELPAAGPLALALFAMLVIWMLAFLVYCWFQAGVYGILWTGDRQAPAGVRTRVAFRTFSFGDLSGWGWAHAWRYFWLFNLFMVLATAWLLVPILLVWLVYLASLQWGAPAAFGLGCGGALPVLFGWIIIALWANLAMVSAARPETRVRQAATESVRVLGNRLGASFLLLVFLMIAAMFVGIFFAPVSLILDVGLAGHPVLGIAASIFVTLIQWLASAFVGGWFSASFVALVRGEQASGAVS